MAVPGVFEMVGLVASILQLAGFVRYLFNKAYDVVSDSWVEESGWDAFVRYLNTVEKVVKPYMINAVWLENSAMINVMEGVNAELKRAWDLVCRMLEANRVWRCLKASSFKKKLEESRVSIQNFVSLIQPVALSQPVADRKQPVLTSIAQVGHAHSGNEDLDHNLALSLCVEEHFMANRIGSSDQVHGNEDLDRALQESLDLARAQQESLDLARAQQERLVIGSTSHSNQSAMVNPQNTMSSYQVHTDEGVARALQERLYIGSPQLSNQSILWGGSSQVENDRELARGIEASLDIGSPPDDGELARGIQASLNIESPTDDGELARGIQASLDIMIPAILKY